MKKLKVSYTKLSKIFCLYILILFFNKPILSNEINFDIQGNKFTDSDVIISLLSEMPDSTNEEKSNEIIKILNGSNLFSDVRVSFDNNKYTILVKEFPNINKLFFQNNERLDNEELLLIASETNLKNLNTASINIFIKETKKIYESFGYNNVKIEYTEELFAESNTADIYFKIDEGNITKINRIFVVGNDAVSSQDIREIIKSKTKSIRNIFANNNFKPTTVERDKFVIINYYNNKGYLDVEIQTKIEYLKSNKVNIYFNINEGVSYVLSSLKINDNQNILSSEISDLIISKRDAFIINNNTFSLNEIKKFKNELSSIILDNGIRFFEINSFEKTENNKVDIIFEISELSPKYTKEINIVGNNRTFDYVIRRELEVIEGDAIYETQISNIRQKLLSLNLFESVSVKKEVIDENFINLIIEVEEKQTGNFNAGVSIGTLDGFAIVTGLRERNFYGTGRSLDVLVNTSEDKNQYKLITTDRLSYENDADISYSLNYKQQDFSKASSYKLDTFSSGIGISYKINDNVYHNIDVEYLLKDYKITNSSTVAESISSSSGSNMSYLIKNNFRYSTLNPGFVSKKGNFIGYNNTIETPTSSSNGYLRNILTLKKYYSKNKNIFSIQAKFGNILSLNNNDILTDNKFSLGGRWLRGFDNFGAGPRNSRSSYVGGNNLIVSKLDYSYQITSQSNFPIYLNLFNDYGLVWENKTKPTNNDNNLRASAGFGIKYYSPIGPIGFTWGFPLIDEEYDIKRMFLFSIGNID